MFNGDMHVENFLKEKVRTAAEKINSGFLIHCRVTLETNNLLNI